MRDLAKDFTNTRTSCSTMASASSRHGWEMITGTGLSMGIQVPRLHGTTFLFKPVGRASFFRSSPPMAPTTEWREWCMMSTGRLWMATADGKFCLELLERQLLCPGLSPGDSDSLQVSNDLGKRHMAAVSPCFFKTTPNIVHPTAVHLPPGMCSRTCHAK